jgi:hypothetical protein
MARLVPAALDGPEDALDTLPDRDVRAALDRLTPRYQQASGLPPARFALVLHRARAALRRELERTDGGPR